MRRPKSAMRDCIDIRKENMPSFKSKPEDLPMPRSNSVAAAKTVSVVAMPHNRPRKGREGQRHGRTGNRSSKVVGTGKHIPQPKTFPWGTKSSALRTKTAIKIRDFQRHFRSPDGGNQYALPELWSKAIASGSLAPTWLAIRHLAPGTKQHARRADFSVLARSHR